MNAALAQALGGVLAPALLSATALATAWRPEKSPAEAPRPSTSLWGAPLALGLGYAAGHLGTHGWPSFPHHVGIKQGLFYVAVVLCAWGLGEALFPLGSKLRLLGRAALCAWVPWFLLGFQREHAWGPSAAWLWSAGLAAALFALLSSQAPLSRRTNAAANLTAWVLVGILASGALHLSGSTSLAQLTGALVCPLGVMLPIALRRPSFSLERGGDLCLVLLFGGLLMAGVYAGELPPLAALALALAQPAGWLACWVRPGRLRSLTVVLVPLLLAALALWIARDSQPPSSPYG